MYEAWRSFYDLMPYPDARISYFVERRRLQLIAIEIDRAFLVMANEALSALEDAELEAGLADLFVANAGAFLGL